MVEVVASNAPGSADIGGYMVHVNTLGLGDPCEWVVQNDTVILRVAKGGGTLPNISVSDWNTCQQSLRVALRPGFEMFEAVLLPGAQGYFNPLLNRVCRGPFPTLRIIESDIPFECECWAEVVSTHLGDYLTLQSRNKSWALFCNLSAAASLPPYITSVDSGGRVAIGRVREDTSWNGLTPDAMPQAAFFDSLYQGHPNQKEVGNAWDKFQRTSSLLVHRQLSRRR